MLCYVMLFIGENAKGTHGEIYKSHTSVISAHFVDQVQIFFFLTHWFQFADDAAVILSGQESENQHLINRFIIWCNWSKYPVSSKPGAREEGGGERLEGNHCFRHPAY